MFLSIFFASQISFGGPSGLTDKGLKKGFAEFETSSHSVFEIIVNFNFRNRYKKKSTGHFSECLQNWASLANKYRYGSTTLIKIKRRDMKYCLWNKADIFGTIKESHFPLSWFCFYHVDYTLGYKLRQL